MTPAITWTLVILAAILTAAIVAVLLQLRQTLKTADKTLETLEGTGRHLNETLEGVTSTLTRVNRAVDELERAAARTSSILEALRGVTDVVSRVRSSMGIFTSIGSAVAGAVLASFGRRSRGGAGEPAPSEPDEQEVKTR